MVSLFASIVTNTSGSYVVQWFLLIVLDKWLWGRYCLYWASSLSGCMKTSFLEWFTKEFPDRSNNDKSLRRELWKNSSSLLTPPVLSKMLAFTMIAGCNLYLYPYMQGSNGNVDIEMSNFWNTLLSWITDHFFTLFLKVSSLPIPLTSILLRILYLVFVLVLLTWYFTQYFL